jgi:hypothetical protein
VDFADAAIDVPQLPGPLANQCPYGRVRFHAGDARSTLSNPRRQAGYTLDPVVRYAHLDASPVGDALLELTCTNLDVDAPVLLVVTERTDHSLQTLGVVNVTATSVLLYDQDTLATNGDTIVIEEMGPWVGPGNRRADKQLCGYQYRAGRFVHVSGPTVFPPAAPLASADLASTTIEVTTGTCPSCQAAYVRFVNGTGRAAVVHDGGLSTFSEVFTTRMKDTAGNDIALALIAWTTPDGRHNSALFEVDGPGGEVLSATQMLTIGTGGILAIDSATGNGSGTATITLRTANGIQTRTYRIPGYHAPWQRLS